MELFSDIMLLKTAYIILIKKGILKIFAALFLVYLKGHL